LAIVIGVRFKRTGKVYYFDPAGQSIREGDGVIVETSRGVEYGDVCMAQKEVPDEETVQPLKPVLRLADENDRLRLEENKKKEIEALEIAAQRVEQHQLDMKLVDVEYTFDQKKIIFYFTADGRVDFRELVRDLASRFRVRIELRQIGVRDETKMLGGLGPCGRPVCCKAFMSDFVPVSIRMAKDQSISLNPVKISGLCGRLMCCLQFEHQFYARAKSELPKIGASVLTPDGPGEVTDHVILHEAVKVRVVDSELNNELKQYKADQLEIISHARKEEILAAMEREQKERAEKREADFAEARARMRSENPPREFRRGEESVRRPRTQDRPAAKPQADVSAPAGQGDPAQKESAPKSRFRRGPRKVSAPKETKPDEKQRPVMETKPPQSQNNAGGEAPPNRAHYHGHRRRKPRNAGKSTDHAGNTEKS